MESERIGQSMENGDETWPVSSMDDAAVEELLGLCAEQPLTVEKPPRTALLMMTVTDSFNTDFHLGEVLVTEAVVLLNGRCGCGLVLGDAPRRALARAVADAVLRNETDRNLCDRMRELLCRARVQQEQSDRREMALRAATKVSFDLMPGA